MSSYQDAVRAAIHGPEVKKLRLSGHEFNVKPFSSRILQGDVLVASGQISHCRRGLPDDQVYYTIKVAAGTVLSIDKWVDNANGLETIFRITFIGGSIAISVFIPPLGAAMLAATGPLTDAFGEVERNVVGSWQAACDQLIGLIGLTLAHDFYEDTSIISPSTPAGFAWVRRFFHEQDRDWVTVGLESKDLDMVRFGYCDRKVQFLTPTEPAPGTIAMNRWYHAGDRDWISLPEGKPVDNTLRSWGYQHKSFSFYAYTSEAPDRIPVYRWYHAGDRDWIALAQDEISDQNLSAWGYTNKTFVCFAKKSP